MLISNLLDTFPTFLGSGTLVRDGYAPLVVENNFDNSANVVADKSILANTANEPEHF